MAKKARGFIGYKSYMFKAKDPVIDELRTIMQSNGGLNYTTFRKINEAGGPTMTTMNSWFFGATMRPQSATIEAAGRAIGHKRVWVVMKGK